jgi:hypothetical protein
LFTSSCWESTNKHQALVECGERKQFNTKKDQQQHRELIDEYNFSFFVKDQISALNSKLFSTKTQFTKTGQC